MFKMCATIMEPLHGSKLRGQFYNYNNGSPTGYPRRGYSFVAK
jgi:hypothetical protein